jgi:adenylate kinase family enzyme
MTSKISGMDAEGKMFAYKLIDDGRWVPDPDTMELMKKWIEEEEKK